MKRLLFILLLAGFSSGYISGQSFLQPEYGMKSHETLMINKIEVTSKAVTFFLSITNKIEGGNFCADQNIFMIYPDGTRKKVISATGIPVCPDTYKFKSPGESLDFVLTFPPLMQGTKWVDLVEDCADNCFSFYGITLDNELNKRIEEAFLFVDNGEPVKGMISLMNIVEETDKLNNGIEGLLYSSIIKLARETGNGVRAAEWYNKLKTSGAPRSLEYLKYLNDQGIKY